MGRSIWRLHGANRKGALQKNALRLYEGPAVVSNLVAVDRVTADPRATAGKYLIDPQAGRIYVPPGAPAAPLVVGYHAGFSSAVGAGGYDRRVRGETPMLPQPVVATTGGGTGFTAIGPGATVITSGTLVLGDSLTYTSAPDLAVDDSGGSNLLVVRADNRQRPLVRLPVASPGPSVWTFTGSIGADHRGSTLVLDGLFVSGGALVIAGDFEQVTLSTTTLDPGDHTRDSADGRALIPTRLRITGQVRSMLIDRSIVGPVVMEAGALVEALTIRDSIVQAVDPAEDALAIDTGMTTLSAVTILGTAQLHQVEAGMPVHALPRILLFFARARWWPIHGRRSRRRGGALLLHAVARPRSSDGCDGRLADGKLSATATAAKPMAKDPT
jgi:hypothetical protein